MFTVYIYYLLIYLLFIYTLKICLDHQNNYRTLLQVARMLKFLTVSTFKRFT